MVCHLATFGCLTSPSLRMIPLQTQPVPANVKLIFRVVEWLGIAAFHLRVLSTRGIKVHSFFFSNNSKQKNTVLCLVVK